MTGSYAQFNNPIPNEGGLIGSFFDGKSKTGSLNCFACNETVEPDTKFCGECGASMVQKTNNSFANPNLGSSYLNEQRAKVVSTPKFAQVNPLLQKSIPPQLKQEYCKLATMLARERAFLLIHYSLFLVANLFGLWCALKVYSDLNADEMTKAVMASIPLLCINVLALGCLVPIRGTKQEISRLKERITFLHYQMKYINLS